MRVWASVRIGFYFFVLGTAVWIGCFPAFVFSSFLLFWGISGGAFAVLLLFGGRLGRRIPRSLLRAADLVLLNLCVAAVALELGLRVAARFSPSPLFSRASSSSLEMIRRHRHAPGTRLFDFPCDSRGYHDRELHRKEGEKLVVSIGDSFGVGIVPHYFHFSTVCERLLPGLEVYNMGINAIGPDEYLHLLQAEALPLEPDAVVVCIYAGNDIAQAWKPPVEHAFLRSWFDRDNCLLYQVARRLLRIAGSAARPPWAGETPAGVPQTRQDPAELRRRYPWLADPLLEKATFSGPAYLANKKHFLRMVCRTDATAIYRGIQDVLRAMDRVRGKVPLLVALLPDEFQVEDEPWNESFAAEEDRELLDRTQPQRLLLQWLEELGIPCLDLLPVFREVPPLEDGSRHLYHLRDTHFNVRGNRVAGQALARFLQAQLK